MKKILLTILTLLALTAPAMATDVAIGPSTIPGFNASNLPPDVPITAAVTFNSPTVTCSNCFRQQWVGLGGFRVTIIGVPYTVAFVASKSSLTLTTNYAAGDNPTAAIVWHKYVELRIYADSSFQPAGETYVVQPGAPGSGAWHRRVAASVVNELGTNNLYIPQIVLDSTTDSLTNQSARYYAAFYRPEGAFVQGYDGFDSFALPPTGASTWPDILTFNTRQVIVQDDTTYTKAQIDAMRTGCTTGQSLFFAVTGLKPACLNFGAGLQLTGDVLSTLAGGSVYATVAEEGTPLTQRTILNFIGSSVTCVDNAGATRTDCSADADLNALASNATNGFWAAGTNIARTLTGTANEIAITNGNGTVGNPVWSLPAALTFTGKTVTGGTYSSPALTTPTVGGHLITLANPFTTSGAFALTLTQTGATNVTLPVTGTLSTLAGTETLTNKTLTNPRISDILDVNGNQIIRLSATGSAVNNLRTINNIAGQPVYVDAFGSDSNIDLIVSGKGTGKVAIGPDGVNGTVGATNAIGTNAAGVHLDLHGGKGTGNAAPGQLAVRYPLVGASGTTLQSLSTGRFPIVVSMFSVTSLGNAVLNTTTETSLFTGASVPAGATRTVEAGMTAAGTVYRLRVEGAYGTTGTPTIQFRIKFGSTTVGDTTAFTTPNNSNGSFVVDTYVWVYSVGGAGSVRVETVGALSPALSGAVTLTHFRGNNLTGVDFTVSQTLDVTVQWGTASASNTIQLVGASITRER